MLIGFVDDSSSDSLLCGLGRFSDESSKILTDFLKAVLTVISMRIYPQALIQTNIVNRAIENIEKADCASLASTNKAAEALPAFPSLLAYSILRFALECR